MITEGIRQLFKVLKFSTKFCKIVRQKMIYIPKSDNLSSLFRMSEPIFESFYYLSKTDCMEWVETLKRRTRKLAGFILFLFPISNILPNTVFVSTEGSDSNQGTLEEPFSTISYAVSVIDPGDTIYILSGIFILNSTIQISSSFSGSPGNPCHLFAYPGDTVIIDFYPQSFGNRGINLRADYWYLKGLVIRNAGDNGLFIDGAHNRIEQCTFYGNDDTGLQISGGGSYNIITNCDAYNNVDPDHEDADGFAAKLDIGPGNEFHGCRSWNNSDDGWDLFEADDSVVIDNCWAFRNGYLPNESASGGDGNGFKIGGNFVAGNHLVKNCIAFGNRKYGYHQNNNTGKITLYNSVGWENIGRNFNFYYETAGPNILTNNISFDGGSSDRFTNCTMLTNSWQGITAGPDDFLSLDPEIAKDARLPDGSLPQNIFSRLTVGSNLIDAGTDIGYSYTGTAPDLGPFETLSPDAEYSLSVNTTGKGGVWLSPPGGTYETDQEVTFIAWNGSDYRFDSWNGDLSGTEDTTHLVMDEDKSVTANFVPKMELNTDSTRIEAEDMILTDYIFERIPGASNGKVIRPTISSFATAVTTFAGEESYYRAIVRYLDYVNGEAVYQFYVNNDTLAIWNGNVASGSTNEYVYKTIINVSLTPGDIIKIRSKPGGQEYGRIDCIDLVKSGYIEPGMTVTELYNNPSATINVYPNPFGSTLNIELCIKKPSSAKLEIFSAGGIRIASLADGSFTQGTYILKLKNDRLTPGIYLLRVITDDGMVIVPVVGQ